VTDLFDEQFAAEEDAAADELGGRRSAARARAARRRAQRRRNAITFVVMVSAIALLVGGAWVLIRPMFDEAPEPTVDDYSGPGHGEVVVTVNSGDSGTDIGHTLVDANVVASVSAFTEAYRNNPQSTQIQAGRYELQ